MADAKLYRLPAARLASLISKREISPVELVSAILERIEKVDGRLNAYITVLSESALDEAKKAEAEIAAGRVRGPLHGIPVSLKDLYLTAGVRTTGGSKILSDYIPTEDATLVKRLRSAGAIILGKLNMHEFAYGATNLNPHYGHTRNPWDTERMTGGSSGGSGAALAAGEAVLSAGSDTGGSIRIPSALCGTVGLKPTYGRVSRHGVLPLCWSLDHAGPMARTVEDAAIMLSAIAGYDPLDPASADVPVPDFTAGLGEGVRDLVIGIPKEHYFEYVDPEVEEAVLGAIKVLESMGARTTEISVPSLRHSLAMGTAISLPEATSYHEEYLKTRPEDYGPDVRTRLEAGQMVPATDYLRAQRARSILVREFNQALGQAQVIAAPTLPITAPRLTAGDIIIRGRSEDVRSVLTRLARPSNLTGLPAISIPCGFSRAGLPIGLQIIGPAFDEATVLRVAHAYEAAAGWRDRWPEI